MIYVTGDIHGNPSRLSTYLFPEQKEMTKDDYVIILGDFGLIFSNNKEEKYWLDWLEKKPFTTLFIDGNHENFDLLNTYPVIDFHGGKAHQIRNSIFHLMRGYVFDICDKKFFAFGGASSQDISDGILDPADFSNDMEFKREYQRLRRRNAFFRVKGVSWWEQEIPNDEEMERGIQSLRAVNNEVDFVLSHCAPLQVSALMGYSDRDKLTVYFDKLLDNGLKFKKWYFGHYHNEKQILTDFILTYTNITRIV